MTYAAKHLALSLCNYYFFFIFLSSYCTPLITAIVAVTSLQLPHCDSLITLFRLIHCIDKIITLLYYATPHHYFVLVIFPCCFNQFASFL